MVPNLRIIGLCDRGALIRVRLCLTTTVAYVFTENMKLGMSVCERLEYGMVGLNRGLVSDPAAPFGGCKQSGLGREGGHEGMLEFTETQYISAEW